METEYIKELLSDMTLLKWVKKFSADNLLDNNDMAKNKFNIEATDKSISILDSSATKLLVTNAEFKGEEFVRFNLKQLADLLDVVGNNGELIIPAKTEMREMIAQVGNDIVVVCPLPRQDKVKEKKK